MNANDSTGASTPSRRRTAGRLAALVCTGGVVLFMMVTSTWQIVRQAFFPALSPVEAELSCRPSIQTLATSLENARLLVADSLTPEEESLENFRDALSKTWVQLPRIKMICESDADRQALRALRHLVQLRYAEERAVRYQANDLSRLRSRAPEAVRALSRTQ
ncbi:MAG: hypothetical protein MK135_05720 [Polyangiaceae bacterium]|nr:hypothetical protein [Polyangiaceae bacterium]